MSPPDLSPGDCHIWLCRPEEIQDPGLLARYHELMSPEEAKRQARFHFERHRHQFLVARALIRTSLSHYAAPLPHEWLFVANEYGRPNIDPAMKLARDLRFNLSHTDGLIACAVTLNGDVGVDVENLERGGDLVGIADRYFSGSEVSDLMALPAHQQEDAFFDYWTLKESYIKARGMGLAIPLRDFSFHLSQDHDEIGFTVAEHQDDVAERRCFVQWRIKPRHKLSLCLERAHIKSALSLYWSQPMMGSSAFSQASFRQTCDIKINGDSK